MVVFEFGENQAGNQRKGENKNTELKIIGNICTRMIKKRNAAYMENINDIHLFLLELADEISTIRH